MPKKINLLKKEIKEARPVIDESRDKVVKTRLFIAFVAVGITVALILVAAASVFFYEQHYRGLVLPGVYAGTIPLGGLTKAQVVALVETVNNRYVKEGLLLRVSGSQVTTSEIRMLTMAGSGDNVVELLRIDSETLAQRVMQVGRRLSFWKDGWSAIYGSPRWRPVQLRLPVIVNERDLKKTLTDTLRRFEQPARNANIHISIVADNQIGSVTIKPENLGLVFDYSAIMRELSNRLATLSFEPLNVTPHPLIPTVTASDVQAVLPSLSSIIGSSASSSITSWRPLVIRYDDPVSKESRQWNIEASQWLSWLEVQRVNTTTVGFGFQPDKVANYLMTVIAPPVEVLAEEARFTMENNKVKEFQGSRNGLVIDKEATYQSLNKALPKINAEITTSTVVVQLSVMAQPPKVSVADVNSLGISGILGVGISTFHDSHTNRIKNITHAVERLNGVLVKPGETFSAVKDVGPISAAGGYLPEKVIKGTQLKNEIGGGLCQIGTTLFRMAMNSGMDITERRNHSLVVSYYADPVNGNPGTDATLYDPSPDFKFINDTGNYLLLQTNIDFKKQQLTFTLWGKPDGRSGSYTHPVVSKWIPAGEAKTVVSSVAVAVEDGKQNCQVPFRGAVASFVYSRVTPNGEKIDRTFESFYRPLPKICMIAATSTPPQPSAGI